MTVFAAVGVAFRFMKEGGEASQRQKKRALQRGTRGVVWATKKEKEKEIVTRTRKESMQSGAEIEGQKRAFQNKTNIQKNNKRTNSKEVIWLVLDLYIYVKLRRTLRGHAGPP